MSLSELEQNVFAYYVATAANDFDAATRWFPYGELLLSIDDKFQMAVRKFGIKARGRSKPAATAFLDHMIEKGGWETKANEYGGTMHQFNSANFRSELKQVQASDAIVQEAQGAGPDFWTEKFAALTA